MNSGIDLKTNRKKRLLMLFFLLGIIGSFLLLSGGLIRAQGEMKPEIDFSQVNDEFSQVLLTGNDYILNQEQEEIMGNITPLVQDEIIPVPEVADSIIPEEEEKPEEKIEEQRNEEEPKKEENESENNEDSSNEIVTNDQTSLVEDNHIGDVSQNSNIANPNNQDIGNQNSNIESNAQEQNDDKNEEKDSEPIDKRPIIETSLKGDELVQGSVIAFRVRGIDYHGLIIDPFNYQVKLNGNLLYSTGKDDDGFVTYRNPEPLLSGENEVSIRIEDDEGNSSEAIYRFTALEDEVKLEDEYVSLIVDARILGLGYLMSVQEQIYKDESAASFVNRVLEAYGFAPDSVNNMYGYYLARLNKPDLIGDADNISIPEALADYIGEIDLDAMYNDSLGERDFNGYSGWVYLYNYSYTGVGLSNITLSDGDEIIICFTLANGAEYDGTWYYYGDW